MAELGFGVPMDIVRRIPPRAILVLDGVAVGAHVQKSLELMDTFDGLRQLYPEGFFPTPASPDKDWQNERNNFV